jgi:uncharacterized protein
MIMPNSDQEHFVNAYFDFLNSKEFPCVAARAALSRNHIRVFVADHIACPKDDAAILQFLYNFVDEYRNTDSFFHSAAVIFKGPEQIDEQMFDQFLWQRLQAISNIDAQRFGYDPRVSNDPTSNDFSFSLKEEAFYIIGLQPNSSRPARSFTYPAFVFNPHQQFEVLRQNNTYEKMKNIVRKRDIALAGSVNPMLNDFGAIPEVFQYSGRKYDTQEWKCPFISQHNLATADEHYSTT